MPFSISGFVLEPPRISQSNAPFTSSPNNFVNQNDPTDVAAYAAAYPTSEVNPRDDYLVMVTSEVAPSLAPGLGGFPVGGPAGLLVNAGFGWTKNEVIARLDYNAHEGRFVPLPGGTIAVLGMLTATPNAQLKAQPIPVQFLAAAPYRLSIGTVGSGLPADSGQTIVLVETDSDFTPGGPASPGTTELSSATGNLNWNSTDLMTYAGQSVRWQQQQYFALGKSTGNIGTLTAGPSAPAILLNPIPGNGQFPLIRIGYLPWLTTVEKPNEAAFTPFPGPISGTVEWALTTGKLNFSNTDVVANAGINIYYDGTLFGRDLTLPRTTIGTVSSPGSITLPSPATGDIIFCLPNAIPYYQFPQNSFVASFSSPGSQGTVQINQSTGDVQFSVPDISKYGSETVLVVSGDLEIDHGVSFRLFRCVVDLDAQTVGVKDITAFYTVTNAVWASPIIGSPLVVLPATPVDDNTLVVSVGQGTGTYVGPLNRVDTPTPLAGLGYYVNFDTDQFNFAQRKNGVLIPLLKTQGFVQLPDTMVLTSNIVLALETGPDTNVFLPLTPGVDCIVVPGPGLVYFVATEGVTEAAGSTGTFAGNVFTDPAANFIALGVVVGDYLVVQSGYATGIYTVAAVNSSTSLTTDVPPPGGSGELAYEILSGVEILADRFFNPVQLTDPTTSVERIDLLGPIQNEIVITSGNATFPNLTTLTDGSANFIADGVQYGDTITLAPPPPTTAFLNGAASVSAAASTRASAEASLDGASAMSAAPTFDALLSPASNLSARATARHSAEASLQGTSSLTALGENGQVVRLVLTNTTTTLTPATPFTDVQPSPYTVSRRLQVPVQYIGSVRFRFGIPTTANPSGVFSTTVNAVGNDDSFTPPGLLSQGTVEISQATGNLNFSQVDVNTGVNVYISRRLTLTVDYQIQPQIGLIAFTQRLLQNEEVLLTYTQMPPYTTPPTPPGPPFVGERGTFLVRKELTQPHPVPTSTLYFNPTGHSVATNPPPAVFRGGRPQVTNTQVTINVGNPPTVPSSMTFLPDNILTDALPHGAIIGPTENVYIDYYVYQAMGGEKTITVLNPPILNAQAIIAELTNSFTIPGNQLTSFISGYLMLVNNAEVYQIGVVSYDPVMNQTTVTLSSTQEFQSDQVNPPLAVASGPTPLMSAPLIPAYFVTELQPYMTVSRGMNQIIIPGNRLSDYQTNTVVYFTDHLGSYTDFYLTTGATYSATANQTTITLTSTSEQQYTLGTAILNYSVRPVFATPPTIVHTAMTPLSMQPIIVFRRITGQVGQLLTSPTGYTIDGTGTVTYTSPLQAGEEFGIFYTGHAEAAAGLRVQASYSSTIAPTADNGLLGQALNANYTLFAPDSFYYRVETLTNFKAELEQTIQAAAQSGTPSSGPMTSNTASTQLYNQGRPSLWFPEGDYANDDIVARACLLFFNTAVNYLEDALHAMDGRVVGDHDGKFMFDGVIGRTIAGFPPVNVLNQIDDLVEVSPFPLLTPPLVSGTYQPIYLAGPYSRFYANRRNLFATSAALAGTNDGDVIAQLTFSNINSLPGYAFKRWPRGQIQFPYEAGTSTFIIDTPIYNPNDPLQRPSFIPLMHVVIEDAEGNVYVPDSTSSPTIVTAVSSTSVSIFPPASVAIPQGATIYLAPSDANTSESAGDYPPGSSNLGAYGMNYTFGHDVNVNYGTGQVLYARRSFPFNGFLSGLPIPVFPKTNDIFPVEPGDILEIDGVGVNATNTGPYKFPALYGGTTDDDGNQAVPIVGPTFDGEVNPAGGGALNLEAAYEVPGSLFRTGTTTPPFVAMGSLDATKTIITLTSGFFQTPMPKLYDLVRIMSGLNGQTSWRRIIATNSTTFVTVSSADAFTSFDTTFSFAVAVSASTVTGTTATLSGTMLTDPNTVFTSILTPIAPTQAFLDGEAFVTATAGIANADISPTIKSGNATISGDSSITATAMVMTPPAVAGIAVGWTVVMTSGPNVGLRRQVVAILSQHVLTLDVAFPTPGGPYTYRVDNPLNTYNGPILTQIQDAVATELATISTNSDSEQNSLLNFFSTIFTNIVGSGNGVASGTILTDTTVDFIASDVSTAYLVYVPPPPPNTAAQNANMGIYQIGTVTDAHDLALNQSFPLAGTVTYQVVSIFGTTFKTLHSIFTIIIENFAFVASTEAFQTIVDATVPVLLSGITDPLEYANGIEDSGDDLGNRYTVVAARQAYLDPTNPNGPITIIQGSLNSSDQLYNKRYTWVDARINLQSGYLALEAQAITQRIATQAQVFNQLIKLLTVQAS